MNAAEVLRLRFQSLLAAGLASSRIAASVGLTAASEVWGGQAPRERPAWYLWLRDNPGAWQVELASAGPLDVSGRGPAVLGRFTVRHYPALHAPESACFSADERSVAAGSLDATGTPRIELAATIPEALFTVGTIDWAIDLETDAVVLGMASLDRLRTRTETGVLIRDVPGWRLTAQAFSLMGGLLAQVERRAARRLVVARLPGFELGPATEGPRDAPDVAYGEGFLSFAGADGAGEPAAAILRGLQEDDVEIVHDEDLSASGRRLGALGADARISIAVSRSWFGGERHAHDRAMCAC